MRLGYYLSICTVIGLATFYVILPNVSKAEALGGVELFDGKFEEKKIEEVSKQRFNTLLKGWSDRENMQKCREGIEETLMRLPAEHSEELKNLILNFEGEGARGLANSDTIILRCDKGKAERLKVFIHEMGHLVFLNSNEDVRNKYQEIWEVAHVSGYAAENVDEDFAESYLAFVNFGESFREKEVLWEKYSFLEENFFSGRAYNGSGDLGKVFDLTKI